MTPHVGVYIRIKHRFGARILEWFLAAVTTLWGMVLLLPAETFAGRGWIIFRAVAPEEAWGILMFLLGLARLAQGSQSQCQSGSQKTEVR